MFSFGLEGFFRILNSVSFGSGRSFSNFWTVLFGFGFRTQPLVSLRIWIVFQTWISNSTFGFSSDWIDFSDLDFELDLWFLFGLDRFFRLGFRTRPLVSLRIGSVFLSDWIFQKYKEQLSGESEGTLDFIVSLRIVYLHKPHKYLKINTYEDN
jgi:hypothetical protein